MVGEDLLAAAVGTVDDGLDLVVDVPGYPLGVGLGLLVVPADEHLAVGGVGHGAELVAHAVALHHIPGDGRGLANVAGGAGGDVLEAQLLRHPAAQVGHDLLEHLVAGHVVLVVRREADGDAARAASGHDGHLVHRIVVGQVVDHHGVAGLVDGGEPPLVGRHHVAALFRPRDDLEHGALQVLVGEARALRPGGQQRRLVEEVLEIRPGEARGGAGGGAEVHVLGEGLVLGVYLQNGLAAAPVGSAHIDLPVEPSRTQQRRVENVLAVGGSHDDDALVLAEAVHLHQKLVEGLLPLVVAAAETCAPAPSHGVNLVDEHDGGRLLLGLFEEIPDAACAHAHVELHKVRAGDGQKLHPGLPGHRPGKERLAGAGRPHQENALGDPRAQAGEAVGLLEKLHHFPELLLLLVGAGHVGKGHDLSVAAAHPGVGTGELAHGILPAAGAGDEHHDEIHQSQPQDEVGQNGEPVNLLGGGGIVVAFQNAAGVLRFDGLVQVGVELLHVADVGGHGLLLAALGDLHGQGAIGREGEAAHRPALKVGKHLGVGQLVAAAQGEELGDHGEDEQQHQYIHKAAQGFHLSFQIGFSL